MVNLYLSLGSNMGDRRASIEAALTLLNEAFGTGYTRLSRIIETPSWGFDAPDFLNCAVLYALPRKRMGAEAQALEVLDTVKAVERRLGRGEDLEFDAEGRRIYHSRPIDIDILFFGTHRIGHPRLQVPHPLIAERDFVRIPLEEIANQRLRRAFPALFKRK
ncbi:MAG: 2-amino-4-hydroxy-6-hydroxymethyldihydropteridine diphosphokinase [Bacteroidales bacterium]|nr:2-amino-4-hydroxy-6-hydroxymethyldihydropteridine diphosphokinase [Bacteroidales bacterium]